MLQQLLPSFRFLLLSLFHTSRPLIRCSPQGYQGVHCQLFNIHAVDASSFLFLSFSLLSIYLLLSRPLPYFTFFSCLPPSLLFSPSLPSPSSLSSPQLYDLASPAESSGTVPGCSLTDASCLNMGVPSCGTRGRCLGEWNSHSCQCEAGYTGAQCEQGTSCHVSMCVYGHPPKGPKAICRISECADQIGSAEL